MPYDERTPTAGSDATAAPDAPRRSRKGLWLDDLVDRNRALVQLRDQRALTGAEMSVLTVVASRVNDGDLRDARVYRDWIVDCLGFSGATVARALRRLRENGWLVRIDQGGTRKVDGMTRNLPSVYDLGQGPDIPMDAELAPGMNSVPAPSRDPRDAPSNAPSDAAGTDAGEGVGVTHDTGVGITHDTHPVSPMTHLGVPHVSPSKLIPSASSAGSACGRGEAAEHARGKSAARTGKRDASRLDDLDSLMAWVSSGWGLELADAHAEQIARMWETGKNWKAIANHIEKQEDRPHRGQLPEPPPPCPHAPYSCKGGRIDVGRDWRDGTVRILNGGAPGPHEGLTTVECRPCASAAAAVTYRRNIHDEPLTA